MERREQSDLLQVEFAGSLVKGKQYTTQAGEVMRGTLRPITGAEEQSVSGVRLAGDGGLLFEPAAAQPEGSTVELRFALDQPTVSPAVLITSSGVTLGVHHLNLMLWARGEWHGWPGGEDVFGVDTHHTLSVRIIRSDEGSVQMEARLDGRDMGYLEFGPVSDQALFSFGSDFEGASGLVGEVHGVRVAVASSEWRWQPTTPVIDVETELTATEAADLAGLHPANYQNVSPSDSPAAIIHKASLLRPTPEQAVWQQEGLTAFIHFGINAFYDQEWGHGTEDPGRFLPSDIDPDAWVRVLRDAGFRTTVITLKHHDGFCLWPSRYTDHSVKASSWASGGGDIARLFVEAAHRYGMKVGFYLSPADSNAELQGTFGNGSQRSPRTIPTLTADDDRAGQELQTFEYHATDYGALFLNTLYEILTEYGTVHEVWFDGAQGNTGATEHYDYAAFYDMIHQLQPGANIAVGGRDIRWVGNESGVARQDEWASVAITDAGDGGAISPVQQGHFSADLGSDQQLVDAVRSGGADRLHWWPTESDMRITAGWFAHPDDVPKAPLTLLRHYEQTYGRNSVMLLNVPPTVSGQFSADVVASVEGFAAERRKAFTLDHALGRDAIVEGSVVATMTNGNLRKGHSFTADEHPWIELDLGEPRQISRVGLSEEILGAGQTVRLFIVECDEGDGWREVARGGTIGAHRIVKLDEPVTAQRWRVRMTSSRGSYTIAAIHLWEQLASDPGKAREVHIDGSVSHAGDGSVERPIASMEQLRDVELATGAVLRFRSGTDTPDADVVLWGYGTPDQPIRVESWGQGAAPTVGGRSLEERFASKREHGWTVA